MAKRETEPTVQQSLLDRLTEEEPPRSRSESVARYRESVRRDVEWLLNTRRIVHPAPEELHEVRHSLYHYGLPDVTSLPADSPESQLRLVRWIEEAIELFNECLDEKYDVEYLKATKSGVYLSLVFLYKTYLNQEEEARITVPCTMNGQIASGEVPDPRPLRRGDELKEFFDTFSSMLDGLRNTNLREAELLSRASAALKEKGVGDDTVVALDELVQKKKIWEKNP